MNIYTLNDLYPTVQGEGVLTGMPMVLVRLHGCPVGCPFCDTKETWGSAEDEQVYSIGEALGANTRFVKTSATQIAEFARATAPRIRWAMLTGGEPALQPLEDLIRALNSQDFKVALETSGTANGHLWQYTDKSFADWTCVSPKINMPGGLKLLTAAIASADEIKMVIGKQADIETLENLLASYPTKKDVQVCLQPMSQSKRATALCVETCMERGWRLSLQTHRLVNIR